MNPIELSAYRMVLKNGSDRQFFDILWTIRSVEDVVPDELLADIILALRTRGKPVMRNCWLVIRDLLGKTSSQELYRAVDELGYFDMYATLGIQCHLSGKVSLFVETHFPHPELEEVVLDELLKWVTFIDTTIRVKYAREVEGIDWSDSEADKAIQDSNAKGNPIWIAVRIIKALHHAGSAKGRESLRAIEYLFRPRVNDYLMVEQKWIRENDPRVTPKPDRETIGAVFNMDDPTVYHLQVVLDYMVYAALSEPQPETADAG